MKGICRITELLATLRREIAGVPAGSAPSPVSVLGLMGKIRDESAADPELETLRRRCADAAEFLSKIVEAGQPLRAQDMSWLKALADQMDDLACRPSTEGLPANTACPDPPTTGRNRDIHHSEEEPPLILNLDDDRELFTEFITESREHLDNIEHVVLVLEERPDDTETLNTIFRAFHTFKGSAGFLSLTPINGLAHTLESLLDLARRGKLEITRPVIDLILRGRDVLKRFVDEIASQAEGSKTAEPIRIPVAALNAEVLAVVERGLAEASVQHKAAAPAAPSAPPADDGPQPASAPGGGVVKVDTAKLDALLDMVGEMVIAQSLVAQDPGHLAELDPHFAQNMAQLTRISKELQRISMSLRMVPIRGLFHKMARVVRDLSAKEQKPVQLVTTGEDTELDRRVVEELNDPLLHMIRNSVDHGVEPPDERLAAGKPATATLCLRAYHQAGNIVIEIEDDGAGLNKDRILAKAIECGLTTPDAALTDAEVFDFVFAPGLSTAETVTDVSGRGVGLDVARRGIERLRGCVNISSHPGKGALFKITLPLTLAIIDGLIVKVGEERFILPTLSVRESFRPEPGVISRLHNHAEVVNVRGRLIPLLRLHDHFGIRPGSADATRGIVVVAQSGNSLRCLLVDQLLHKQEVVIKNLNDLMVHKNPVLAGATILADGRVGLILDVNALVHLGNQPAVKSA